MRNLFSKPRTTPQKPYKVDAFGVKLRRNEAKFLKSIEGLSIEELIKTLRNLWRENEYNKDIMEMKDQLIKQKKSLIKLLQQSGKQVHTDFDTMSKELEYRRNK